MAHEDDAARYRQAAQLALDQLEWCVAYFRSIHKTQLADQIARNRATLIRRLREPADGIRSRP